MTDGETSLATLYVVRHGRTGGNAERYLGWTDEPLDDVGHEQARTVARALSGARVDAICSSPFSRAVETARPLALARDLTIHRHDDLRELNFGDYQGLSKAEHPLAVRSAHALEAVPGGESLADLQKRCRSFLAHVRPRLSSGDAVVVTTHFWTSRVLVGTMLGLPLVSMMDRLGYKPSTGSVLQIDCRAVGDDRWDIAAMAPLTGVDPDRS